MTERSEALSLRHLSHSALTTYMGCGEQYRLTRRYGYGGSSSWALVGGSAFHTWTERYDEQLQSGKRPNVLPIDFVELLDAQAERECERHGIEVDEIKATGRASKAWPDKRNRDWWVENGVAMATQYTDWRLDPENMIYGPDEDAQIELKIETEFAGIPIVGYIDRLLADGVLDIKTGKEPATKLQLGTYAVAVSEALAELDLPPITKGYYYLAEKGEIAGPFDMTQFSRDYVESLYEMAARGIASGVYLPNPNAFCSSCEVRDKCRLYGNNPPVKVPLLEPVLREGLT